MWDKIVHSLVIKAISSGSLQTGRERRTRARSPPPLTTYNDHVSIYGSAETGHNIKYFDNEGRS